MDGKALGEIFREYSSEAHGARHGMRAFAALQARGRRMLVECGERCGAVVGCRVSPRQKRDIVRLVLGTLRPAPVCNL